MKQDKQYGSYREIIHLVWRFWHPPVCDLVHPAPHWVTATNGDHVDVSGGTRGGPGHNAPCPWSRGDGDGDGGDDDP